MPMEIKPLVLIITLALAAITSSYSGAQEPAAEPPAGEAAAEGTETAGEIGEPAYGGLSLGTIQPPTADEESALKELAEDIEIYDRSSGEFRAAIKNIIKREYELRRKQIEEEFIKQIEEEERLEEEARMAAIVYFEAFLDKYPDNAGYTPDATFRLSELYYEQSYLDYLKAYDEHREQEKLYQKGLISALPEEPERDFSQTIEMYEKLITRYPDYRNIDGVYYLLGFCFNEMGKFDEAKLIWLAFACSNRYTYEDLEEYEEKKLSGEGGEAEEDTHVSSTLATVSTEGEVADEMVFAVEAHDTYKECKPRLEKSRFFTETWLRIGEYHFDFDYSKMGLSNAISAYSKATEDKDSTFYDLALYKLAWSYWRHGNYVEAIRDFMEVVEYSDRKAEETGKSGSQLRPEAIQYIALSLWEPDWDGDGAPDPVSGLDRLMDPAYVPQDRLWTSEVFNWLGDVYIDDNANMKAIKVFEEYLGRWPNASEAPDVVIKIAKAYQREKMEQQVIDTRARLAQYGKDSDWWKANMDKPEIQQKALIAAEEALKQTALHHHEVAQNVKTLAKTKDDPAEANELFMRAIDEYNFAASAYHKYLGNYPNSADSYEMHFFMAEAYFWSKQYEKSIPVYEEVRDSQMDNRYQKDAAFMVVKAIEQLRDDEVAKGMLTVREGPPEPMQGADGAMTVSAEVIPSAIKRLADSMDAYMKLFPKDRKNASAFTWNPAELYYNYGHWEEAMARFEKIYDKYCKTDNIGLYSWQNMTTMAVRVNNVEEAEKLAFLQEEKQCGLAEDEESKTLMGKIDKDLKEIKDKKLVREAMKLFEDAEATGDVALYEEAADQLEIVVSKNPQSEEADKFLWNASIAFEKCNKFQSALRITQKIIDDYPKSEFLGDALFKLAENSFKAFEYNKALNNFKILADESKFKDRPDRKAAVLNTALILENQQKYKDAAKYWKRYSEMTDKIEEAVDALWNAARGYEKGKMWSQVITEMKNFENRFAATKEAAEHRVEAAWAVAQAYKKLGKKKDYEKALADVIVKYNFVRSDLEKGSMATDHAAEAKFVLVEKGLSQIEKFKLNTNKETQVAKDLAKLKELRDTMAQQYAQVVTMASPDWTVAGQFRIGYLYEMHSKILLDAPVPKSIVKLGPEAEEMYLSQIMSLVTPLEDGAQKEYATALKLSKAAGVFNKWTELTLERLNAYNPDDYPMYKKGKTKSIEDSYGVSSFDVNK